MTKAMLLWAMENMDSWLKKTDCREIDDEEKMIHKLIYKKVELHSPLVKMAGCGEDLVSFVVDVAAFGGENMKQLCRLLGEMTSFWEDNKDCSFLADSGDENMEKLYSFLVGIANSETDDMKKLLIGIADSWKDKGTVNEEMMNSLLIVMAGLGRDNKEKLFTSLVGMVDFLADHMVKMYISLIGNENENEYENWKKVMLYIYLDRMTDFCKAQVGMPQYSREAHKHLCISMNTLVRCWRDNNKTVKEEIMNSFVEDLNRLDTEKHYSLVKDFCQHHKEKLIGKGSFEMEKKMELYTLVDRMANFCYEKKGHLYYLLVVVEDPLRKYNKEFIIKFLIRDMADFGEGDKEIVDSLVVEMLDFWEHNNKEKLYSFLVRLGDPLEHNRRDIVLEFVSEIRGMWKDNVNKEKVESLMVEVTDICVGARADEKQLQNLMVEMAGNHIIINKDWLFKWVLLKRREHDVLHMLLDLALQPNQTRRKLKEARNELSSILGFLADKTLTLEKEKGSSMKYLIYEVLEIALLVIQFQDSHPLVLLSQIFNGQQGYPYIDLNGLVNEFSENTLGKLRNLKDHILKFDFQGMTAEGLEEDIKLLLHNEDMRASKYMTKAMLLSAIENMDSWLKKADCREQERDIIRKLIYKKVELHSPLVKMAGCGEDLVSFVVDVAAFGGENMKQLCRLLGEMTSFWEDNKDCSFLADSGDENMEKLYSFVGGIVNSVTDDMKKLLVGIADSWKDKGTVNEEIMKSLLIAMAGLGKDNKEKLFTSLVGMVDFLAGHIVKMYISLIGSEKENENENGKKVMLYKYLDRMTDFCKVQVGMAQHSREAHRHLVISMTSLVECWRDNNKTVKEEIMNRFLDDLNRLDMEKHYSLVKDFGQHHKEKLYRLLIGKGSFEKEKEKKMELYSLVDRMADFCYEKKRHLLDLLSVVGDPLRKYDKDFITKFLIHDLAGFEEGKEIVYSLVVEMMDIWEHNNKEKLYSFLVRWGDPLKHNKEKLLSLMNDISDPWEGNVNREKLYPMMHKVTNICLGEERGGEKQLQNLVVEMARNHIIINEERRCWWRLPSGKRYRRKYSNCDHTMLLNTLLDVGLHHNQTNEPTRTTLKEARTELSSILDFLADKTLTLEEEKGSTLHYLISEILEIARLFLQFQNSDPLALLSQVFNGLQGCSNYIDLNGVVNEFSQNTLGKLRNNLDKLKDLKQHILKSDFEGRPAEGLEEDIKLLLHNEDMRARKMTRAILLSAIVNMDSWLKKADWRDDELIRENDIIRKLIYKKVELCSPLVKMAGFGEDMYSKEKLLSFVVDVAVLGGDNMKQLCRFLGEMASFWENNEECSFLVDSGDENMMKLYSFLVGIANSVTDDMTKLLIGIADSWKDKGSVNEEIMNSLLIAMAGLGRDNKEKLFTSLVRMLDFSRYHILKMYESLIGNENGNEKKVKLYIFLDRMAEYYSDEEKLQRCLNDLVKCWKDNSETVEEEIMYSFLDDVKRSDKEKLYSLVKDFCQHHKEQLYRLLIGKGNFEMEKKMKLYSLVDRMADFCDEKRHHLYRLSDEVGSPLRKYIKEVIDKSLIHEMADFGEDDKEIVYSLVVQMLDIWEYNNKEKFYSFLVKLGDPLKHLNKEKLLSFMSEISDLWEDNVNKEKVHSMMVEVTDICLEERGDEKQLQNWVVEMAGNLIIINKARLLEWVAKWEHNLLLNMMLDVALNTQTNAYTRTGLTEIRTKLSGILGLLADKTLTLEESKWSSLHYLISEVLEINAHLLIQLLDSDPLSLLSQIFNGRQGYTYFNFNGVVNLTFKDTLDELGDLKKHILQFDFEAESSVGEFPSGEGGSNVVGLEEDIALLLPNDEDMCALTVITGMVGMGKTTLARELYNHPTVVHGFDCRAWVCVSDYLCLKSMLITLLQQLVDGKEIETDMLSFQKMDNKSLTAMLHQHLQCMRYFIVLDDMKPSDSYLLKVFDPLLQDNGSRLLFTTRALPSSFCDEVIFNHKMKFLDDVKSWELLLETLFFGSSDKNFPKHLKNKGRRTLKKCNGLPLAIKEVGRHWAEMIGSGSKWDEVVESIDLSETLRKLDRTYNTWPSDIQDCFLYLSFFREGATIRTKRLEYIWAVEQLRWKSRKRKLCILSEANVIEFKNTIHDKIKMCHINPLFQMLSIAKAQDKLGLEILNKDGDNRCSQEPRRRVIYCSREKLDYSTDQDKHIVSLFFLQGGYFDTSSSYWNSFERLEILDMEDFGLKMLPDAVGTLFQLKYLGLRSNYIKELPPSLGELRKLEVLDIAQNFMVEVPNVIWGILSLWRLYVSGISFLNLSKIYKLKHLEILSSISMYSWIYELSSLESLYSLKKLGIEEVDENSDVSKLFASLAKLNDLTSLVLRGFCFRRMPSLDDLRILKNLSSLKLDGRLPRLPSVSNFPRTISRLNLVNSSLDEDPMPILEKLPQLCSLKLQNAYTGEKMVISSHRFDNLLYLYIAELWHLKNIEVGEGAMPKLRELEINSCPYLETLPEETWPKELKMVTTKNIATKLRKSRLSSRMRKVEIQP